MGEGAEGQSGASGGKGWQTGCKVGQRVEAAYLLLLLGQGVQPGADGRHSDRRRAGSVLIRSRCACPLSIVKLTSLDTEQIASEQLA